MLSCMNTTTGRGAEAAHLSLGRRGEDAAVAFLVKSGRHILARNWRPRIPAYRVELDCVARDGEELVFVEVKTRKRKDRKDAIPVYAAFTPHKRKKIITAARLFLAERGMRDIPCRFDLICVEYLPDGHMEVEHYTDVIELGHLMGNGHALGQLW